MLRRIAFGLLTVTPLLSWAAAGPTIADFAGDPSLERVKISPDGDYIAARVHFSSGPGIAIIRLSDNKLTASISFGHDQDLYNLWWVGPRRVVFEPSLYEETGDVPSPTGELIGMDADAGNPTYLFGYQGSDSVGSHLSKVGKTRGWAHIIDPLPGDPRHAIIAVDDMDSSRDTEVTRTYKLNVEDGLLSDEVAAPTAGYTSFLTDNAGNVRYAVVDDAGMKIRTFIRNPGEKGWQPVNSGQLENAKVIPLGFSRDNSKVFLESNEGGDRTCLVVQTLATGERKKLACDADRDLTDVIYSLDGREPIGAYFGDGKGTFLDPDDADSVLIRRLQVSFKDSMVTPISQSADGAKLVIEVWSDRDPGTYYLVDTKSAKATLIAAQYEPIYPDEMSERRPVSFQARDGQQLNGFLTIPKGHDLKNLPLVVHPHGGPLGIADHWAWDADSQMLASRGYAVLQVNFRGSAGYGEAFEHAGRQGWDTVMIDDITDGTRWAIKQGFADPERVCIYGGSYGGYAALESAVREPTLYRCAISMAGVYDLNKWHSDTDITRTRTGSDDFSQLIGSSAVQLGKASPINHLDQLKAALFIAHGGQDERVPVSQADTLMKALDARHYPYEKLIKPDEGHGFYNPKNREEFYTKLVAFLDNHIGVAATVGTDKTPAQESATPH